MNIIRLLRAARHCRPWQVGDGTNRYQSLDIDRHYEHTPGRPAVPTRLALSTDRQGASAFGPKQRAGRDRVQRCGRLDFRTIQADAGNAHRQACKPVELRAVDEHRLISRSPIAVHTPRAARTARSKCQNLRRV